MGGHEIRVKNLTIFFAGSLGHMLNEAVANSRWRSTCSTRLCIALMGEVALDRTGECGVSRVESRRCRNTQMYRYR